MRNTELGMRHALVLVAWLVADLSWSYVPDSRWSSTASGSTGDDGSPVTLSWSIIPDGTTISGEGASDFVGYFDGLFGETTTSSDLTQRAWFGLFEESFDRWSDLTGITFLYEPNDTGSTSPTFAGSLGVRGDIRVGGAYIDGASGTLAYAWTPNTGDIVFDTGETTFYSNSSNNYRQLRNTLMHELGHALGLLHVESSTDRLLMEPFLDTSFDGPQLDDIRGMQAFYGDPLEKTNGGAGNESYQLATALGSLVANGSLAVGSDAVGGQSVSAGETDFVSIADSEDDDFFSFSIASPVELDATLTPLGGVFSQGAEGGSQSTFDANSRNDLALEIYDSDGGTLLASADLGALGDVESITGLELDSAGEYYARVTGDNDSVQFYELALSAVALQVALAGDYNADGLVDAADYTVWRNSQGESGAGLAADGNGDGTVNDSDYDLWAAAYASTEAASAAATPEPSAVVLVAVPAMLIAAPRARRRLSGAWLH